MVMVLVGGLLALPLAVSAGGQLDPAFGNGGKVVTDLGASEAIEALVVQPNGKIIAVGQRQGDPSFETQFALVRYERNGVIDPSFGTSGKVITTFGGREARAFDAALQPDGKIIAAGIAEAGARGADLALARYHPDGSLDSSFGASGRVLTDFNSTHETALGLVLQPDGKIVVAGYTRPFGPIASNPSDFAIARYNPDGTLDGSFDGDGKVTTDFASSSEDRATAIATAPDGKLVAVGYRLRRADFTSEIELARYNSDGSLDASFDGDGKVLATPSNATGASDVVVEGDAKIVVAGEFGGLGVARYASDGRLDASYGSGGVSKASFPRSAWAEALARQPDGATVVAGVAVPDSAAPNDYAFAIARFDRDGKLDRFFGAGSTDVGSSSWDEGRSVAVQGDGRIVVGGFTAPLQGGDPVGGDFALVRYIAPPPPCRVPNVRGQRLVRAKGRIRAARCVVGRVKFVSSRQKAGRVIRQSPRAGVTLATGSKVSLVVGRAARG
jgi:uncharacterized delta-60 repeat protein